MEARPFEAAIEELFDEETGDPLIQMADFPFNSWKLGSCKDRRGFAQTARLLACWDAVLPVQTLAP